VQHRTCPHIDICSSSLASSAQDCHVLAQQAAGWRHARMELEMHSAIASIAIVRTDNQMM
jgi:hypothetical protein